jgi:carboxylesterase
MAQHSHIDPSSFFLPGGATGILLVHGFTGSPPEMRLVGDYLNTAGLTVSAPLLPGHGTRVEDMYAVRWTGWAACVETAYRELAARCQEAGGQAFIAGLSLGSLLSMNFAAAHPELPGAILYSPATWIQNPLLPVTPLARYFIKTQPVSGDSDLVDPEADARLWCYDSYPVAGAAELYSLQRRVRRLLPMLEPPLLIVYSTGDRAIHPTSARRTFDLAGSQDKQIIELDQSGHAITVDSQWRYVAEQTLAWVKRHGG